MLGIVLKLGLHQWTQQAKKTMPSGSFHFSVGSQEIRKAPSVPKGEKCPQESKAGKWGKEYWGVVVDGTVRESLMNR